MALTNKARRRLVIASTSEPIGKEIADAIDHGKEAVASYHDVVGAGQFATRGAGQAAVPVVYGTTLGFKYALNTHEGYRTFKISPKFYNNASFHIHWTKSTNVNESGNSVKWRISYTVTNGRDQDINITPQVLEFSDTYDDSGTTTKIVHRTAVIAIPDAIADYYLAMKIEAITPDGTPLSDDPVLVSCDLRYDMYINQ